LFCKKKVSLRNADAADLNQLVQGGKLYRTFSSSSFVVSNSHLADLNQMSLLFKERKKAAESKLTPTRRVSPMKSLAEDSDESRSAKSSPTKRQGTLIKTLHFLFDLQMGQIS
jgi:hypothetical protein